MKTIDEDIRSGQFQNIYLLYGSEHYLRQQYKQKLKQALIPADDTINFSRFEGQHTDVSALIDLAETLPFFADYRLILIEDSGFFKNGCETLVNYLPHLPSSTVIVFSESEIDKRGRLYKSVKKSGRIVEFEQQNEQLLTRWILGRLKRENKKITQSVLQLFLSKTGMDMSNIDKELEKLLCYTLNKEIIEAADIEAICTEQVTNQIFEMVNAIGKRDQARALSLYYDLLALKEAPMRILFLINRQFRILLDLKSMKKAGVDAKTMAAKAGIPPFAVKRSLEQAARFPENELHQALKEGTELETDIKTGKITDQIAVELLLIKYSSSPS
ncbi:putative protein YqeN [Eubacterium plexicaudatum ASF492]|uniref:DNA polymerase III subunit delta n=1 Tax=Eubacterium plexicaudatum ASF492 TaxID=1235802 RepID=N2BHZ7_9FIRM|nr:putative protein YqeN [Eubacterium plexicaudatum ASF492]